MKPSRFERRSVPITSLITSHDAMNETLESGRKSETPNDPIFVNHREDNRGLEIGDGHHRVADALRAGKTHIEARIDPRPDDEPYDPPFYDFAQHFNDRRQEGKRNTGKPGLTSL